MKKNKKDDLTQTKDNDTFMNNKLGWNISSNNFDGLKDKGKQSPNMGVDGAIPNKQTWNCVNSPNKQTWNCVNSVKHPNL